MIKLLNDLRLRQIDIKHYNKNQKTKRFFLTHFSISYVTLKARKVGERCWKLISRNNYFFLNNHNKLVFQLFSFIFRHDWSRFFLLSEVIDRNSSMTVSFQVWRQNWRQKWQARFLVAIDFIFRIRISRRWRQFFLLIVR